MDFDINYVRLCYKFISIIMYGLFYGSINKVQMHNVII